MDGARFVCRTKAAAARPLPSIDEGKDQESEDASLGPLSMNEPTKPSSADPSPRPPPRGEAFWRWLLPITFATALFWAWQRTDTSTADGTDIAYSELFALVAEDKVDKVTMTGPDVRGSLKAPEVLAGKSTKSFRTTLPAQADPALLPLLREHKVMVVAHSEEQPLAVKILVSVLPWVLIIGGWVWLSRRTERAVSGAGLLGGFSRERSRRFSEKTDVKVRFDDVAGLASAKRDLHEVVEFLREPVRFQRLGAHVPRGILLVGPPGTGKTLLARAVAGEAGVPFFSINGSEFIELFVGIGASRVRELFETAKKSAPAIVFIDEIDAVGRSRGTGLGGGHDEREQTLNQLLSEMDGFARNDLTIVLAATNRPDVLDSALLRPGRFDRRVLVDRPERAARRAILGVHARNKPLGPDVDLDTIAAATPGFSGADLANLVNEAAILATRRGATAIEAEDFWSAQDKVEVGDPRETPLSSAEKRRIAVHESGHALVAHLSPAAEPLKRVTIIPRGMTLGSTRQTPGEDKHVATRSELWARLRVLMGGYAAEQAVLGETSSGAENDLRQATEIAYDMVAHYGMSDAVGPVFYEHRTEHPFLGMRLASESNVGDAATNQVDAEVQRTLAAAAAEAKALVQKHRHLLDRLVGELLTHETVEQDDLRRLLSEPPDIAPRALA
jgi:cell division protease FtsH